MVAENYKIKVPGVMKNHILGVHVLLAVLKMTGNVRLICECIMPLMLLFNYHIIIRCSVYLTYHHTSSTDYNVIHIEDTTNAKPL